MARRWNPAKHPRYSNGQFRPKFTQSVRLSPISVSYNAGARVPIVPGRANLYVGALVRVEKAGRNQLFKRQTDRFVNSLAGRFGDKGGRSTLSQILKGNELTRNGVRIQGPRNVFNTPNIRLSSTPASRAAVTPRPLQRSTRTRVARAPSITAGTRTAPRIARAPRRRRPRSLAGGRVKR